MTESREAGREGMERTRKREGREGRTRGRGVSEVLWKTKMGASKKERREEKNEREIVRRERGRGTCVQSDTEKGRGAYLRRGRGRDAVEDEDGRRRAAVAARGLLCASGRECCMRWVADGRATATGRRRGGESEERENKRGDRGRGRPGRETEREN